MLWDLKLKLGIKNFQFKAEWKRQSIRINETQKKRTKKINLRVCGKIKNILLIYIIGYFNFLLLIKFSNCQ